MNALVLIPEWRVKAAIQSAKDGLFDPYRTEEQPEDKSPSNWKASDWRILQERDSPWIIEVTFVHKITGQLLDSEAPLHVEPR